jgi:hypothetical protein
MSRFGGLKAQLKSPEPESAMASNANEASRPSEVKGRDGKKMVAGYFSSDLSLAVRQLALIEGTTVQSLLGEAVDLLMRNRGKHPFGER